MAGTAATVMFWDRLLGRGPDGTSLAARALPPGSGPLVWVRFDAGQSTPEAGAAFPAGAGAIVAALRRGQPHIRVVASHPAVPPAEGWVPDPGDDSAACQALLAATAPAALLLLGGRLPAALLGAAERQRVPVVLADAALGTAPTPAFWHRGRRGLLAHVYRIFVPDNASRAAALRHGAPPARVEVTGIHPDPVPPLGASEAERASLAGLLRGRQVWLAVAIPEAEEDAVITAHQSVLEHAHRALLILAPADTSRAAALMLRLEADGMAPALRSREDEIEADVQVMVADDPSELGLWYRVAPISYFGGTLSGADAAARDPMEAAALGSAILHGPRLGRAADTWRLLDRAGAALPVRDGAALGEAVDGLAAPDQVAALATAAWSVSTAGAAVAQTVARAVLDTLPS